MTMDFFGHKIDNRSRNLLKYEQMGECTGQAEKETAKVEFETVSISVSPKALV